MADEKTGLTLDQADALIGVVGTVRNPSKGPWPGQYVVTGYDLDPADDLRVKTLKAESTDRLVGVRIMVDGELHPKPQMVKPSEVNGRPVVIAERPVEVWPRLNPRWFTPLAAPASTQGTQPAKK